MLGALSVRAATVLFPALINAFRNLTWGMKPTMTAQEGNVPLT